MPATTINCPSVCTDSASGSAPQKPCRQAPRYGKHRPALRAASLIWLICCLLGPVYAQQDTGTISGTVKDSSGAVLPGVAVVIRNVDTNEKMEALSGETGAYITPPLKPGRYSVSASLPGFKTRVHQGIEVQVQQRAVVDLMLEVGEVTEQLVVSGEAPLIEAETTALGHVVEEKRIVDLPLNGRNYLFLARNAAGVLPAMPGARGEGDFNANGNRSTQNNFLIDGIDNNSQIVDLQSESSQVITPSVDAIKEFKVQTSQYSAEFGHAAGAVINVLIKSGTNRFHGSLFEFLRNDALDAVNFFAQDKPALRYNQFGGTFGGPVRRDQTFFFGSYQGTRQRRGQTFVGTVPTLAMRSGDLSDPGLFPVFDPATTRPSPANPQAIIRDRFSGNRIPKDRWDPVSARLLEILPSPNRRGRENEIANNFVNSPTGRDDRNQYDARVDHSFSEKDKVFGRVSFFDRSAFFPPIFYPSIADGADAFEQTERDDSARSLALSETHVFHSTLVNEFRFGWNRLSDDLVPWVKEFLNDQFGIKGIPRFEGVTGLPRFNVGRLTSFGGRSFTPNSKNSQTFQYSENLNWIRGTHSMKIGFNFLRIHSGFGVSSNARGDISFSGIFTARDDLTASARNTGEGFADFLLGYVGGTTVTSLLTGSFRGRSWEAFFQDDWKTTSRLTLNLGVRYDLWEPYVEKDNRQSNFNFSALRLVQAKPEGSFVERALIRRDKNNISPRLGAAYLLKPRLVVRAGYGIFYSKYDQIGASGRLAANPPFFFENTYPNDRRAPSYLLSAGVPSVGTASAIEVIGWDPRLPNPYAQQWSLNLQVELNKNTVLSLGYTGNKGTKFLANRDANAPRPGPGGAQARRPLPALRLPGLPAVVGAITMTEPNVRSSYHAGVFELKKRFSRSFSFHSAYTYGQALDSGGNTPLDRGGANFQDPLNIQADKAAAAFDVKHRWVSNWIWEPAFGRQLTGWTKHLLAGWEVSGIALLQTGTPFSPAYITNIAGAGNYRPDRVRDGRLDRGERSIDRWFDIDAFAPSEQFKYGNAGRDILRNPGFINFDAAVFKNFSVTEDVRVQFRSEFFNALNTPHFLGTQFGGSRNFNVVGRPEAGKISAASDPRIIQLALKLTF